MARYQQPSETAWLGADFLIKYREPIQVGWEGTEEVCMDGSPTTPAGKGSAGELVRPELCDLGQTTNSLGSALPL